MTKAIKKKISFKSNKILEKLDTENVKLILNFQENMSNSILNGVNQIKTIDVKSKISFNM